MVKLLIIADDFTGALDTGVQFAKKGIRTYVKIVDNCRLEGDLWEDNDCQVLVLDIESRHASPDTAMERVSYAANLAYSNGVEYIYKKTDSTLRGNVGSELTALLRTMKCSELIFVPAFPKASRVTISGRHLVSDIPLNLTEFARDLLNPVNSSMVKDIIREQSDIDTREVHLGEYEQSFRQYPGRPCISIVDAKNDDDLFQLGHILKSENKLHCLAGCAGFAEILPELLGLAGQAACQSIHGGKTLLISGSLSNVAKKQVEYAQEECGYHKLSFPLKEMMDDSPGSMDTIVFMLGKQLHSYDKLALEAPDNLTEETVNLSEKIANRIGEVTFRLLNSECVKVLIVFGGDTLMGIMRQLKCNLIEPLAEIETGVVLSVLHSDKYRMHVITKAGGLGESDVVEKIERYISGTFQNVKQC